MWRAAWAKAPRPEPGERQIWLPLHVHLMDTGAVAGLIWSAWLGAGVRAVIAADFAGDERTARLVVQLAAALHDIGKLTRAFAGQVPCMRVEMEARGFGWAGVAVAEDARSLPHALAGHILIVEYLRAAGVPESNAAAFAVIAGGHHGVPPNDSQVVEAVKAQRFLGRGEWDQARADLTAHVIATLELAEAVEALKSVQLSDASQLLVTAVVIMADWIASNPQYFPLVPAFQDVPDDPQERATRGWQTLGLPHPWRPTDESLTADVTELLRSRFQVDFEANEVQQLAVEAARQMPEPGLLLIEAVMGAGKTEAAMLAAEVLARRFGRSGIFYGLPTRATTDAMFDRALTWWKNVPGEGQASAERGMALRHSTAALNDQYRALPRWTSDRGGSEQDEALLAGELVDVGLDEPQAPAWEGRWHQKARVVAHHWTSGRKQASFSDTVIATIDHQLLAALTTRHVVLRHLGLARQVVILDELHAADSWMSVFLEGALEWLGRYRVPVIALSATLPPDQRQRLADAYEKGRRAGAGTAAAAPSATLHGLKVTRPRRPATLPRVPRSEEYPLVTTAAAGEVTQVSATPPPGRSVDLAWLRDDLDALTAAVDPVVTAGGCVLVVRNTVARAVATYRHLRGLWGEGVALAHSRFIAHDRMANDTWLRENFGPGDHGDRRGRIVVATQVAEQSLDVDFDLLVTDLAPIDLVLQRIGRLHRHARDNRPAEARRPRCLVTGLAARPNSEVAPGLGSGAVKVYGEHLLLRSAALIHDIVAAGHPLRLPDDVPALVRDCYGETVLGPPAWQPAMAEALQEFRASLHTTQGNARTYLLRPPGRNATAIGLLEANVGEAESSAGVVKAVRQSDGGFEVIVLERADDGLRLLPHLDDGRPIPTHERPDRDTVRLLARSSVRVPGWVTTFWSDMNTVLNDLAKNYYAGWQRDPVLSGQLVLLLDPDGSGTMGPFRVTYDREVGLEVSRG